MVHSSQEVGIPTALEPTSFGPWDTYAICPECSRKYRAAFGNAFHVHASVCDECGNGGVRHWPVETLRWVGFGRLFRPSTWGVGCWQTHGDPIPSFREAEAFTTRSPGTEPHSGVVNKKDLSSDPA